MGIPERTLLVERTLRGKMKIFEKLIEINLPSGCLSAALQQAAANFVFMRKVYWSKKGQ